MVQYYYKEGVLVSFARKYFVQIAVALTAVFLLSLAMTISSVSAKPVSGPGKVSVGVDASTWTSGLPSGPGLIPIGGAGQVNGEFTTAERNGIQIGLRAQNRFTGTLDATPNQNGKVGIYDALTGTSDGSGRATWNYDWTLDLRNAQGVAAGKTLSDYTLVLETDIATTTLFGLPLPLDLTFGGVVPGNTILYQSSQNPKFGNPPFNSNSEGIYNFRLVLTPKTFNGPELAVAIQVNVTD